MTGKIKLVHSGGNSVSLAVPTSNPSSSEVAFKLPTADGSAGQVLQTDGSGNLSWVSLPATPDPGLQMADQWRTTSDQVCYYNTYALMTNWERPDTAGFGQLGTGMTVSSDIFSFPSTGIYYIQWHVGANFDAGGTYPTYPFIRTTTSGETPGTDAARGYITNKNSTTINFVFDVTNTSTHKVAFYFYQASDTGGGAVRGDTNFNENFVTFLKLGAT